MNISKEMMAGKRTPGLTGFSFDPHEAIFARDRRQLLSVRIEINTSCNLQCRYCFTRCSKRAPYEVDFEKLKKVISEAAYMKAKSVIITGGGEPLLHSRFMDIITFICQCGLQPVVFSNAILITSELASFLYQHNVSVMAKIDSLHPATQDNLAGLSGAYVRIQAGLHNLLETGFSHTQDPNLLRLGVTFVANAMNINEIDELWHFCRRNHVFPHIQFIYPERAKGIDDLLLSAAKIRAFKKRLHFIDKEHYGYDWMPYTPFITGVCLQHFYSLYVTVSGDIRPCIYINFDEHSFFFKDGKYPYNAFEYGLFAAYEAEPFVYARSIDSYMEGKCAVCSFLPYCIGCRGYAYRRGINNGLTPYEALRISCQLCHL
ncbi:MAG TPA: radical SAM protein [Chitinispirillaceae bacterium]|nr:radical SAM protein [Chitinispirillaceae bacterium]